MQDTQHERNNIMEIETKIRQFIVQNLYFSEDNSLSDDASFLDTGVVDSMGVMELATFVESEFGVSVEPQEVVVTNFGSIRQLADFVRRKLGSFNQNGLAEQECISSPPVPTL
jgi:acyl carrier protein